MEAQGSIKSFMPAWATQQKSILNINEKQYSISMLIGKVSLKKKTENGKCCEYVEDWNLCPVESVAAEENITAAPHLAPKAKDKII